MNANAPQGRIGPMITMETAPRRRQSTTYAIAGRLRRTKVIQTAHRGEDRISMYVRVPRKSSKYARGKHQFVSMKWIPVMLRTRRGGRDARGISLSSAIIEAARRCATAQAISMTVSKAHGFPCRFIHWMLCQMLIGIETPWHRCGCAFGAEKWRGADSDRKHQKLRK